MPVDKLNGRWFDAYSNDLYMSFDGVGNYALSDHNKVTANGTYIIKDNKVTLNEDNGELGNCTIENDYHELHCDKYTEIFMK